MTVSIKDIARAAAVSHSTVSRALSDSPLVSADTKARIQRLAQEMGYSPDAQARSLVMGRTLTVGLAVTTLTDPFIAEVVQAVEGTAHEHGYSVILATFNSRREREIAAVEMLQSKRVDAVIVTSSRVGAHYLAHIERLRVPVVLINTHSAHTGPYTFSVNVDNRHGAFVATGHLAALGHARIAYVTGAIDHSDDRERLAGYRDALAECGLAFDRELVVAGTGRTGGGERALPRLIALEPPPSAVFCYNDLTAIGLIRAAHRSGLDVPDDLAVVGFDDIPFASYVEPPLTTVAQPTREMGRQAVEMALGLIDQEQAQLSGFSNIVLQGKLIVRESSGAKAHGAQPPGAGLRGAQSRSAQEFQSGGMQ